MEKRWAGRVAECSGLENRRGLVALPGFESLAHRHFFHEIICLISPEYFSHHPRARFNFYKSVVVRHPDACSLVFQALNWTKRPHLILLTLSFVFQGCTREVD